MKRATLADIWPLVPGLLLKGDAPPERPIQPLARIDATIRPLNPNVWPKP